MNYIKRSVNGVICDETLINSSLISFIDRMCLDNLSTYKGRLDASKRVLGLRSNVPIYVSKSILLYPTECIRNFECAMINYYNVLSVEAINKTSVCINFIDGMKLMVFVSQSKINIQTKKCDLLIEKKVFTQPTY